MRFFSFCLLVWLMLPGFMMAQSAADTTKPDSRHLLRGGDKGIEDRGFTTHNRSNIGMFIENRGKLYARSNAIGVSGEYPINSEQEYIFQLNPVVLLPGNVIQGRNTSNEEWEAEFGFNNPEEVRVATSTAPETWPADGWPVKDADGAPIFISDQDTYAAYNDSLNREEILDISMYQTGYSFASPLVRDAVVFTFDVVNRSDEVYEDMYFGMYSDIDVGNRPGTDFAGYLDDRLGYDDDLDFFYYFDNGFSPDWGGPTGHFGLTWIDTPPATTGGEPQGLTNLHYNLWQDTPLLDENPDWFYAAYTSNYDLLPEELHEQFFHPAEPGRRFDDLSLIPEEGIDLTNRSASGPYTLAPGDTLSFVIAVAAGSDYEGIRETVENLHQSYQNDWLLPSPPPRPELQAYSDKNSVTLSWDNRSETEADPFTGAFDFQGYRLYRSIDQGRSWDQIDRNRNPEVGPDPVPIAEFDKDDEEGLRYSFVDNEVREGFTYWYSLTAYDEGLPELGSLESAIGSNEDEGNIAVVTPRGQATNWLSSRVQLAEHIQGLSTDSAYVRVLNPLDETDDRYEIRFSRVGEPQTTILTEVKASALNPDEETPATTYTVSWSAPDIFSIRNDAAGRNRLRDVAYVPGQTYEIEEDNLAFTFTETSEDPALQPDESDELKIVPALEVIRLGDGRAVLPLRPYQRNVEFTTTDGVAVSLRHNPFEITRSGSRIGIEITEAAYASLLDEAYDGRISGIEADSVFVEIQRQGSSNITEYGIENGSIIDLGRFSFRLTLDVEDISPGSLIDAEFSIRSQAVRFPTEGDLYRYEKDAGLINATPEDDVLSDINVVPNPYLVSNAWEPDLSLQRREPERLIRFRNLPAQCSVHIFTMAGERVKTLQKNDTRGDIGWNLRSENGREIAPGVYIYLVESDAGEFISRFAVIK